MKVFNTLTRTKEELVPLVPGEYRIYVCGPTVYNFIHIGNARPVIVFDVLRRYLEYGGARVKFVSNITDIDDKLIRRAGEEGVSMQEIARKYEAEFIKDCDGLNVLHPTVRPRATEHIEQILSIVKDLIESGHAYVAKNGDVYFRVKSDPGYGKLSHLNLEDLESGNRELRHQMDDDLKEDAADFAVWKAAKPGEPYWDSPLRPRPPRLAHRVQRDGAHASGRHHRHPRRRRGSDLPAPRERDRPVRVRQRLHVRALLDAQRVFEHRQPQDVQERGQLLHRARAGRGLRLRAHPLFHAVGAVPQPR